MDAMNKSQERAYPEFRHIPKNFEGGFPKNILEKKTVF
jgi:hypothetical protein